MKKQLSFITNSRRYMFTSITLSWIAVICLSLAWNRYQAGKSAVMFTHLLICSLGLLGLWKGYALLRSSETALARSEERCKNVLETAMDGFWVTDDQGRLQEVNAIYCRMSGYSEQELLSMHISDLEAEETADEIAAHMDKVLNQGEDRFESRHLRKDGSLFDVEIRAQRSPAGDRLCTVFLRDITIQKQAEQNL